MVEHITHNDREEVQILPSGKKKTKIRHGRAQLLVRWIRLLTVRGHPSYAFKSRRVPNILKIFKYLYILCQKSINNMTLYFIFREIWIFTIHNDSPFLYFSFSSYYRVLYSWKNTRKTKQKNTEKISVLYLVLLIFIMVMLKSV